MSVLRKFLLLSLSLLIFSSANASGSPNILGDEYWPYPFGTECPFPWDRINSSEWLFDFNNEETTVRIDTKELLNGKISISLKLMNKDGEILSEGQGPIEYDIYNKIVPIYMTEKNTGHAFFILLRLYPDKSTVSIDPIKTPAEKSNMCRSAKTSVLALTVTNISLAISCQSDKCHSVLVPKDN